MSERYPLQAVLVSERCTSQQLCDRTGIDYRTLVYWTKHGLTPSAAERVANAVGLHPASIWPEWFDVRIRHEEDSAARRRDRSKRYKRAWRARRREAS